jgi:hypothetical protein
VLAAITSQLDHICAEVLATSMVNDESLGSGDNELGIELALTKAL